MALTSCTVTCAVIMCHMFPIHALIHLGFSLDRSSLCLATTTEGTRHLWHLNNIFQIKLDKIVDTVGSLENVRDVDRLDQAE